MGVLATMLTSTVKGTDLGGQILRNTLFLRYVVDTPYLPLNCEGCNDTLSISRYLYSKKGGLIINHHTGDHTLLLREGRGEI